MSLSALRSAVALLVALTLPLQADITVRGKAVDADNAQPLAELTVSAEHLHADRNASEPFSASVQTAADGSFALVLPQEEKDYTVLIRDAAGRLRDGFTHIDEDTDLGTLKLSLEGECSGVLRGANGVLANVEVVAEFCLRKTSCKHFTESARTRTDAEGAFTLEALPPGTYRCYIDDHRFAPHRQDIEIQDDFAYLELVVEPGCTIKGKVLMEDGYPAVGMKLRAGRGTGRIATTDVNGAYTLSGLENRSTTISLVSDDYTFASKTDARVEFKSNTTVTQDFRVAPAATLHVVLEPEPGAVLPKSVSVELRGKNRWQDRHSGRRSVTDGVAVSKGVPPGSYWLQAYGDGVWVDQVDVELVAGKVATQTIAVVPTVDVDGSVTDAQGQPVEEARISFVRTVENKTASGSYSTSRSVKSTATDKKGAFSVSGVTPGAYEISGRHENFVNTSVEVTVAAEDDQSVDLVLENACTIEGAIVTADGKGIEEAEVTIIKVEKTSPTSTSRSHVDQEESGDDGRFSIGGLARGEYELKVEHDDFRTHTREIEVVAGTNQISPTALDVGLIISGVVTGPDGKAPDDVNVTVSGPRNARGSDHVWKRAELESDGSFAVGGLADGSYSVSVQESRDTITSLNDIKAGTDDLFVSLGAKLTVAGMVVTAEGAPIVGAAITAKREASGGARYSWSGGADDALQTDARGAFSLELREGDSYGITATLSPYLPGNATVDLKSGDAPSEPTRIVMKMGSTVRGVVVREADGGPVKDVGVRVGSGGGWFGGFGMGGGDDEDSARTDAEGRFEVVGVARGVVELMAYSTDDEGETQILGQKRIMVESDTEEHVRIELPAVGSIEGVCRDVDGSPLAETPIMLQRSSPTPIMRHTTTADDGTFKFTKLPAGIYQVYATPTDDMDSSDPSSVMAKMIAERGTVKAGEVTRLVLRRKSVDTTAKELTGVVKVNGEAFSTGKISFQPNLDEADQNDPMAAAMRMYGQVKQAEIGTDGAFSIKGLEPGKYTYTVAPSAKDDADSGSVPPTSYAGEITVEGGATEIVVDITGLTLSGTVRGENGAVEDVEIYLVPEAAGTRGYMMARRAASDEEGRFTFECLQSGAYKLHIRSSEAGAMVQNIDIGDENIDLDLALEAGVGLKGSITTADGEAILQVGILVLSEDAQDMLGFAYSESDGGYEITSPVPKGKCLLLAFRDGYSIATKRMTLSEDTTWDVQLWPGGGAEISVVDADGLPVSGKDVEVRNAAGKLIERCRNKMWAASGPWASVCSLPLDGNGKTTMKGLAAGTYTVLVEGSDASATFSITALETTKVSLTL